MIVVYYTKKCAQNILLIYYFQHGEPLLQQKSFVVKLYRLNRLLLSISCNLDLHVQFIIII